jgi:plasmid replication initiation protein
MEDQKRRARSLSEALQRKKDEEQAAKDQEALHLASEPIKLSQVRSERHFMRFPLFATEQGKRLEPIEYSSQDGKRFVTVTANHTYGMATQRDADVLRFAISKLTEASFMTGGGFTSSVAFTRYEVLKAIGKDDQKKNYEWLDEAIHRLSSTSYHTNIFSSEPNREHRGPLATFEVLTDPETKELRGIAVHFSPDVAAAIKNRGVLAVKEEVLLESGGLRKRLLELVQVHMGEANEWRISMGELSRLCAFTGPPKRLKEAVKRAKLPYRVSYQKGRVGPIIGFEREG